MISPPLAASANETGKPTCEPPSPAAPPSSPPCTVLFVDHTATLGGGEIALLALAQNLNRSAFTPVVLLFSDGPLREKLEAAAIETHVLPLDASVVETRKDSLSGRGLFRPRAILHMLAYIRQIARFMRTRQVSLVHTNSLKADVLGGLAARLAHLPVIWHVRDRIEPDYLPGIVVRGFRGLCRILPHAVLANSQSTLQTLHLPPSALTGVAYSGMSMKEFGPDDNGIAAMGREEVGPFCAPHIGIVGRLAPWKGQHLFLEAVARVRQALPEARFSIIGAALFGEEEYEARLRARAAMPDLNGAVSFLGFRSDVPALMRELDIVAHASTSGEPFGQVVLQAMAAGRPVVATNGGGVTELVVSGETGLLVPMNDADALAEGLLYLLAHPDEARAMGRAGRQRAESHFTLTQTVKAVETSYRALLAKTAKRAH